MWQHVRVSIVLSMPSYGWSTAAELSAREEKIERQNRSLLTIAAGSVVRC